MRYFRSYIAIVSGYILSLITVKWPRTRGAQEGRTNPRTGVMAPVSAGFFFRITASLPLFVSAGVFIFTAGCSLALPFERVAERKRGQASFAH